MIKYGKDDKWIYYISENVLRTFGGVIMKNKRGILLYAGLVI